MAETADAQAALAMRGPRSASAIINLHSAARSTKIAEVGEGTSDQ
jgi:hypothetical protein